MIIEALNRIFSNLFTKIMINRLIGYLLIG